MHDICREAAVSPGALYVYFDSKEALIAGICERDRQSSPSVSITLAAAPDFMQALRALGEQYFLEEPAHKAIACASRSAWSPRATRGSARSSSASTAIIVESFEKLFRKLKAEGRIAPALDIPTAAKAFTVICDGMFWRRAVDPAFDPGGHAGGAAADCRALLNPVTAPASPTTTTRRRSEGRS